MTLLQLLGYISDVWVLGTYAYLSRRGQSRPFHWANALGAAPLLVAEYQLGAWQVIPLTGTFCVLGWYGLWSTRVQHRNRKNHKLHLQLSNQLRKELRDSTSA